MNPLAEHIKQIEKAHADNSMRPPQHFDARSRSVTEKLMADISYLEHKLRQIDQKRLPNTLIRNNYLKMLKSRKDVLDGIKHYKQLHAVPSKTKVE